MIPIPALSVMLPWLRIGALVTVAAAVFSVGAWTNGVRWEIKYNALDKSFTTFKASVSLLGEKARTAAAERKLADLKTKEKADASNARMHANSRAAIERLRRERDSAGRSVLPAAPTGSSSPQLLCLDRAEYSRTDGEALSRLRDGARRLADEGTAATVDLDTAKIWAKEALSPEGVTP